VKWSGVRFSDFANMVGTQRFASYGRLIGSDGYYIDEDMATLTARVAFLQKPGAWGEEPASRARRFITNLRVRKTADGEYETTVNLLLTVLREGSVVPDIVVGERRDKVRKDGGEFKISRRHVLVDNGSLPGRALSVPV